jgi:hypothetical protein
MRTEESVFYFILIAGTFYVRFRSIIDELIRISITCLLDELRGIVISILVLSNLVI